MGNVLKKYPIYFGIALLTGILINWLLFFHKLALGFFIFNVVVLVLFEVMLFITNPKKYINWYLLLTFPLLFSSAVFFIRADYFVLALNFIFLGSTFPMYYVLRCNPNFFTGFSTFELPFALNATVYFDNLAQPLANGLHKISMGKFSPDIYKILGKIIIALCLTIPVFLIVLIILTSGDQIFSQYTSDFLKFISENIFNFPELVKLAFAMIFGYIIWSNLAGMISRQDTIKAQSSEITNRVFSDMIIPTIFVNALNLIYLGFILVQFGYLFGGESFTHKYNVVFSEYAIKGFWEMLIVLVINYFVLYLMLTKFSLKTILAKIILIPTYLFTLFASLIMLISSYTRIMVYINGYGFTRDRLIPLAFLIFVALVIVLFTVGMFFKDQLRKKILKIGSYSIAVAFLMGFSVFNMDALIVDSQMHRKTPDVWYVFEETSLEGKVELFKYRNQINQIDDFESRMFKAVNRNSFGVATDWQGQNIYDIIFRAKFIEEFDQVPQSGFWD